MNFWDEMEAAYYDMVNLKVSLGYDEETYKPSQVLPFLKHCSCKFPDAIMGLSGISWVSFSTILGSGSRITSVFHGWRISILQSNCWIASVIVTPVYYGAGCCVIQQLQRVEPPKVEDIELRCAPVLMHSAEKPGS